MIDKPKFNNEIWNPLITAQLGQAKTTEGKEVSVIIVVAKGEDGKEATLLFPGAEYAKGVAALIDEAAGDLDRMESEGFDAVVAAWDEQALDQQADDDPSGLIKEGS